MYKFRFDEEKAVVATSYVSNRLAAKRCRSDFHKVFKVLYFADQKHLARYGRSIFGDEYIAMEAGPVPSALYDLLKSLRDHNPMDTKKWDSVLQVVENHCVHPACGPDLDALADSEIECLEESIRENGSLSFGALRSKSHDAAYDCSPKGGVIPLREIAKAGGADAPMLSYIRELAENDSLFG